MQDPLFKEVFEISLGNDSTMISSKPGMLLEVSCLPNTLLHTNVTSSSLLMTHGEIF